MDKNVNEEEKENDFFEEAEEKGNNKEKDSSIGELSDIKELDKEIEKAREEIDDLFLYEKILLDYNIVDFTMTSKMMDILTRRGNNKTFNRILDLLQIEIALKVKDYLDNENYFYLSILQNYLIFFMIITINLKENIDFIKCVFKGKNHFFSSIVNCIMNMYSLKKSTKSKIKILLGILNNLFLEEYKSIYFREIQDEKLEKMFIDEQISFSAKYVDIMTYYDDRTYEQMFDILYNFDLSYDNFFLYYHDIDKINDEDKPAYKLCVAQSVIRVAFSKEKVKYIFDEKKLKFFEYDFLKKVIDKDMAETKKKFGDEVNTLFRKEDLCDDIIKYMFFIFGNTMIIEAFVKPLRKILGENTLNKKEPTKEEFDYIMKEMIGKLIITIPLVLKIVLKLVYKSALSTFTIAKDNYSPLYTLLIFNFIISPRIQTLYNLSALKSPFIRSLNRLIRNSCYNFKFEAHDPLFKFNEDVERIHNELHNFIDVTIRSIQDEDEMIKNSLSDLFTEKVLIYPRFLFYWDSKLLCAATNGGVDKIIIYEELKQRAKTSFNKPYNI